MPGFSPALAPRIWISPTPRPVSRSTHLRPFVEVVGLCSARSTISTVGAADETAQIASATENDTMRETDRLGSIKSLDSSEVGVHRPTPLSQYSIPAAASCQRP